MTDASGPILVPDSGLEAVQLRSEDINPKYAALEDSTELQRRFETGSTSPISSSDHKPVAYFDSQERPRWWRNKWLWGRSRPVSSLLLLPSEAH